MTGWETTGFYTRRVMVVWKAIMTGLDHTALGLQGGITFATNPVVWSKALVPTAKAAASAKTRAMLDAEREAHPSYERYKGYGLALMEHGRSRDPASTEFYGSDTLIDRIPGVAISERSFSTFLNELRFNLMQVMEWAYTKDGRQLAQQQGEALARVVNAFTFAYKPKSHQLQAALKISGEVFWAPSMYVARVQLVAGAPVLFNPGADSRVRMMAAKQYIKAFVGIAAITAVLRMLLGDDDDEVTPIDADYYKVKSGDKRMDWTSGLGQMLVFMARGLNSAVKARFGKPIWKSKGRERGTREIFGSFASFKTNPWVSAIFDLTSKTDVIGRPTSLSNTLLSNTTPLSVQTLIESVEEAGVGEGLLWTVPGVTGRNLTIYDRTAPKATETFQATLMRLMRDMAGKSVSGLEEEEMKKWLPKVTWDYDLSKAEKYLSDEQMELAKLHQEEKRRKLSYDALFEPVYETTPKATQTKPNPKPKRVYKSNKTYTEALEKRDNAMIAFREHIKGWPYSKAEQLLKDHFIHHTKARSFKVKATRANPNGENPKYESRRKVLRKLYGLKYAPLGR